MLTVHNRLMVHIGPDSPPVHLQTNREVESGLQDYPKIVLDQVHVFYVLV